MKRVFVCEGMKFAKNNNINIQAKRLGRILAANPDVQYVQGGSNMGLMGETLAGYLETRKDPKFFIPENYWDIDSPALCKMVGKNNFDATKTKGEAARLQAITNCDQIIVMPGGLGTLEELLYCNETSRSGEHSCGITVVNIDGFYDGLLQQLDSYIKEGLLTSDLVYFSVVKSVDDIVI